jgi:hypothetical protein
MMNEVQIKDQAIRDLSLLFPSIYSSHIDSYLLIGFSYER